MMKKIPLKIFLLGGLALVVLIIGLLLGGRVMTNHSFVNGLENGEYSAEKEKKLLFLNFPEGYVPYYNLGNAAYQNGDYTAAISYYMEALKRHPAKERDCETRINLALSMCYSIDFDDLGTQEKKDAAISVLKKARDVLLEKGCATDENDGHNDDAQQLKNDIDKMLEQLENNSQGDSGDQDQPQDNQGDDSSDDKTSKDREKQIQKQLEQNRKDAMKEGMNYQKDMDKWSSYSDDGDGGNGYDSEQKQW
jgi:tetratricopeptide (TPR) repeat protein